jgi:uncharacterized protein (DUF433 family)
MTTELLELQTRLEKALHRIDELEERLAVNEGSRWRYLIARPHRWRRQLSLKGRNLTVGQLVSTIHANRLSAEQASANLELPLAAVYEALVYHAENQPLIELEATEERRRLAERGYALDPKDLPR